MYIRSNNGLAMVARRGMGWIDANARIHPDVDCGPSASYSVGANVGPWPGQLTAPQKAVFDAANWQPNTGSEKSPNPVSNLIRMIPSVDASGATMPTFIDLDGSVIDPASLIAKSMQALAMQQCYPWTPGIPVAIDPNTKQPKMAPKASGSNFYNDNIRPSRFPVTTTGPADIVSAAGSSSSSSSGPPGYGGANMVIDSAIQRQMTYDALAKLPFERLPLQAVAMWNPGVDYSQLASGGSAAPPPPPSPVPVTPDPAPSQVSDITPPAALPTSTNPAYMLQSGPVSVTSAPDLPPGLKASVISGGGGPSGIRTPRTQTHRMMASPANNPTPMVAAHTPAQATPATATASTGVLDSALAWIQANPMIAGAAALSLVFLFSRGGKR